MQFEKHSLFTLNMPYALGTVEVDGEHCVIAAPEDRGPLLLIRPPYRSAEPILPGPGGCMALIPDPERDGEIYSVMGCFLGYKFQGGAVYRIVRTAGAAGGAKASGGGAGAEWSAARLFDLPFGHRIELVSRGGTRYLVAAALAADKRDPADWSLAGSVVAAPVPADRGGAWRPVPILEGIHKNHGLLQTRYRGRRSLLVAGSEGLFVIDVESAGGDWSARRVFDYEVSEMALCDLDGDGADELVTIEPFHGNRLRVYRDRTRSGAGSGAASSVHDGWESAWEAPLDFGHCLATGRIAGRPGILVSNRAGSRDLMLYRFPGSVAGGPADGGSPRFPEPERIVVDAGAGSANMVAFSSGRDELIFATNQAAGELVVYTIKGA